MLLGLTAIALLAAPLAADRFFTARQLFGGARPPTSDLRTLLVPVTLPLGGFAALGALALLIADSPRRRVAVIAAVGALSPVLTLALARPALDAMYPWESFGRAISVRTAPVWLLGRRAPSLTFYAHEPVFTAPDLPALEADIDRERAGWLALTREEFSRLSADPALARKGSALVAERGRMVLVWFGHDSSAGAANEEPPRW
jgi:hypothetical protein